MTIIMKYRLDTAADYDETEHRPDALGPGLHAEVGFSESGAEQLVAIQFDADTFTEETATAWLEIRGLHPMIETQKWMRETGQEA